MEYLIKVSAVTFLFYACYKLFLQRDTFFESNRWFLLIGMVVSFIVPLIVIPVYVQQPSIQIQNFDISNNGATEIGSTPFNILEYLPFIYLTGVFLLSVRFIVQLTSLFRIISLNKIVQKDGFKFIETSTNTLPFSFFNWVDYNPVEFKTNELELIIAHEKIHVKQYHSIDSLLIQILSIVLWFNPFIWFYSKDLKQNLEFIADKYAQQKSDCKKSYQYALLKTSISTHQLAITNNFYNSLIKKRIIMLQKSKSKKINLFKYALVIPILAIFVFNFNTKLIAQNKKGNQIVELVKTSDSTNTVKINSNNDKNPLIIVDGKEIPHEKLESINPENIKSIDVLKDDSATKKYGIKGKNGIVEITTKNSKWESSFIEGKPMNDVKVIGYEKTSDSDKTIKIGNIIKLDSNQEPLIILDGKEMPHKKMESINQDRIEAINVLKDESGTKKYGDKGKNGVIEITSKKK